MPKAQQDALLHPAVHAPAAGLCGIGLRRADLAAFSAALNRANRREVLRRILCRLVVEKLLNRCSQACTLRSQPASPPAADTCFDLLRGSPSAAAPSAAGRPVPAGPSAPSPHFTGIGIRFDEVHLHQRQVAALQFARGREIAVDGEPRQFASSRRESGSRPRRSRRARRARSAGMVIASSPESTMKLSGTRCITRPSARCCPTLPSRRRYSRSPPAAPASRARHSRPCGPARCKR